MSRCLYVPSHSNIKLPLTNALVIYLEYLKVKKMPVIVNCEFCNKTLRRSPSRATGRNFCNNKCSAKGRTRDTLERFYSYVDKKEGCHLWKGTVAKSGYGVFMLQGNNLVLAHRFSYEQVNGSISEGLHIDHLCRNRLCVNPDHLEAVTNSENVRRELLAKHPRIPGKCSKGHDLTPENTYFHGASQTPRCLTCKRENYRRWWHTGDNKLKHIEKNAKYRNENRERIRANNRRRYAQKKAGSANETI